MHLKELVAHASELRSTGKSPRGTYEFQPDDIELQPVVLSSGCFLMPATYAFSNTEAKNPSDYASSLRRIVDLGREEFDFVFLDAQAGSDIYAQIAISRTVSDEVVLVSEYDPVSASGMERLKAIFRDDLTYERTWILLNKMLPEFVRSFSDFLEIARYLTPVPWSADVVRGPFKLFRVCGVRV